MQIELGPLCSSLHRSVAKLSLWKYQPFWRLFIHDFGLKKKCNQQQVNRARKHLGMSGHNSVRCLSMKHESSSQSAQLLLWGQKGWKRFSCLIQATPKQKISHQDFLPTNVHTRMCCQCCENSEWSHFSNHAFLPPHLSVTRGVVSRRIFVAMSLRIKNERETDRLFSTFFHASSKVIPR